MAFLVSRTGIYTLFVRGSKFRSINNLPLPSGVSVDVISFWLRDTDGTAISAKILPMGAPVLSDWQTSRLLNITGGQKCGCSYKGYSIGSEILKVISVPEPASVVLLLIGAFIAKKRGQNR